MLGTVHLHGLHVLNSGPGGEGDIEVEGNIKLTGALQNANGIGDWRISSSGIPTGGSIDTQMLILGGMGWNDTMGTQIGDSCNWTKGTIVMCKNPGGYSGYICACNRKPGSATDWTYQFIGNMSL